MMYAYNIQSKADGNSLQFSISIPQPQSYDIVLKYDNRNNDNISRCLYEFSAFLV